MSKNKKMLFLLGVMLIIIIVGITIIYTKGMNYGLSYGENTTIEMYLTVKPETSDIKNIVTEIFGKNNNIRIVENLKNDILITVKSADEQQINTLISKINEKYSLEITNDDLEVLNNAKMSLKDVIFPYIAPSIISTLVLLLYFIIRYRKQGIIKVFTYTVLTVIGAQLLYFSIYAIVRAPINELTMPISMILLILSFILLIETYEKNEYIKKSQK